MKVRIFNDYSDWSMKIIIRGDDNTAYSFSKNEFINQTAGSLIEDDCILKLPEDIYNLIAQAIKSDDSVPDKRKEYVEGKLEATQDHLKDMKELVVKAYIKNKQYPGKQPV